MRTVLATSKTNLLLDCTPQDEQRCKGGVDVPYATGGQSRPSHRAAGCHAGGSRAFEKSPLPPISNPPPIHSNLTLMGEFNIRGGGGVAVRGRGRMLPEYGQLLASRKDQDEIVALREQLQRANEGSSLAVAGYVFGAKSARHNTCHAVLAFEVLAQARARHKRR